MIEFWIDADGVQPTLDYLGHRGAPLAGRWQTRTYDEVGTGSVALTANATIFAGLDRATPSERVLAALLHERIRTLRPDVTVLNDPGRVLGRLELLDVLADRGINTFHAYPAADAARVRRFPVFVRPRVEHFGSLTELLPDSRSLKSVLGALRWRGYRERDLLIVEFCDTRMKNGTVRKYSAYRIGSRIVPCEILVGPHWMLKDENTHPSAELLEEELDFIETNPHGVWIGKVFDLAGVEYGRIDYGLLDGVPQAWEVNVAPTMSPPRAYRRSSPFPDALERRRQEVRAAFHDRLRGALAALDEPRTSATGTVEIPVDLVRAIRAERAARAVRKRRRSRWQRIPRDRFPISLLRALHRRLRRIPYLWIEGD